MVRIMGYGEDALTFWALTHRLSDVLRDFDIGWNEDDFRVIYRPSFGRGGRTKANFGEFDAIIATSQHFLPVESKWGSSSEWQTVATVSEHIYRLRRKIEANPAKPRWIETLRGVGYRFVP